MEPIENDSMVDAVGFTDAGDFKDLRIRATVAGLLFSICLLSVWGSGNCYPLTLNILKDFL
jgi:hypothetical protein